MNKIAKTIFFFLLVSAPVFSQSTGHRIDFTIAGLKDTVQFGYYWADREGLRLERKVGIENLTNGTFSIQGTEPLKKGLYFVVIPNKGLLELVINDDQFFSVIVDTSNLLKTQIQGNDENVFFYDYLSKTNPIQREIAKLQSQIIILDSSEVTNKEKKKEKLIDQRHDKQKELQTIRTSLFDAQPDYFVTKVLSALDPIVVPEMEEITDSTERIKARQFYYRTHFLDRIDFADEGFVRTPILKQKLEEYLTFFAPVHDTMIRVTDELIASVGNNL